MVHQTSMNNILDKILATKRQEIAAARAAVADRELERRLADAPPPRDFRAALDQPGDIQVIAEVKKASPSAGIIRADFDPVAIAAVYEKHGAACVSVLTDETYFQGHLHYLTRIRAAVNVPLLRKDFIVDRYQLLEARLAGADAALLIAEALPGDALAALFEAAQEIGLQTLVEIHDAEQLERVLDVGAQLVGINNRDLRTFTTRLEHTLDLLPRVPADCCLVSESGIRTREDVLRLEAAGVRAVLVGEVLMAAPDMGLQLDRLRGRVV